MQSSTFQVLPYQLAALHQRHLSTAVDVVPVSKQCQHLSENLAYSPTLVLLLKHSFSC